MTRYALLLGPVPVPGAPCALTWQCPERTSVWTLRCRGSGRPEEGHAHRLLHGEAVWDGAEHRAPPEAAGSSARAGHEAPRPVRPSLIAVYTVVCFSVGFPCPPRTPRALGDPPARPESAPAVGLLGVRAARPVSIVLGVRSQAVPARTGAGRAPGGPVRAGVLYVGCTSGGARKAQPSRLLSRPPSGTGSSFAVKRGQYRFASTALKPSH